MATAIAAIMATAGVANTAAGPTDFERITINPTGNSWPGGGSPTDMEGTMIGDRLYVWAWGPYDPAKPSHRMSLWAIDGSLVSEVAPEYGFSGGNREVIFNNKVIFQANAPGVGLDDKHIWEYDGTVLRDLGDNGISGLGGTLEVNGLLYEGDYDGLFVYDGNAFELLSGEHVRDSDLRVAPDGSTLVYVTDGRVRTYDGNGFTTIHTGTSPQFPHVTSTHVFFQDSGVLHAYDWSTGATTSTYVGGMNWGATTSAGLYLSSGGIAKYCTPGMCEALDGPSPGAYWFRTAGDNVYFTAPDSEGNNQLWIVRAGQLDAQIVPINPTGSSNPSFLSTYGDNLLLSADGGSGTGYWQVDGMTARLLAKPAEDGDSDPWGIAANENVIYFSASDGTARDLYLTRPLTSSVSIAAVLASPNPKAIGESGALSAQVNGTAQAVEYFIGDDPGQGSGSPMVLDGPSASATIPVNLNTGVYDIGVRAQDTDGGTVLSTV